MLQCLVRLVVGVRGGFLAQQFLVRATHQSLLPKGLLGALLCAAALAPQQVQASIAVGSSGQASYGMAITVPPGIAGMAPNLSLSYADGGINGPLGVGWSVQGISSITRCGSTQATDGTARNVRFDGADKLCLDGQRLIQFDVATGKASATQQDDALGVGWGSPREFRTEKDTYARIRAYGSAGGNPSTGSAGSPARGPAYFKVWTKSGQIYEYGLSEASGYTDTNAQITRIDQSAAVMVWAVRRITDTFGNYIEFKYEQRSSTWGSSPGAAKEGREWNVSEVLYTGTASGGPRNKVVFEYEDRLTGADPGYDQSEAYQFDNKNVSVQRLKQIRTYINAHDTPIGVKRYALSYERSPATGRSRLTEVKECAGASFNKCLPPTKFAYRQNGAPSFVANATFGFSPIADLKLSDNVAGNLGILTGDFDGDGRTDVLRWGITTSDNLLYRSLGTGEFGLMHAFNLKTEALFSSDGCYSSMVADLNGDGLSDILRTNSCSPFVSALFLSRGDGTFTTVTMNADIDLRQTRSITSATPTSTNCPSGRAAAGSRERTTRENVPSVIERFLPVPLQVPAGNLDYDPGGICTKYTRSMGRRFYLLDVNGDGLLDIVTTVAPATTWTGTWENRPPENSLCVGGGSPAFNGPCTRVFLGSASGTFAEKIPYTNVRTFSLYSDPPANVWNANPYWRWPDQADIDGDGLQDILALLTGRWRSLGNGDFASADVVDSSQLCGQLIDFNGDGRTDCLLPSALASQQRITMSFGPQSTPPVTQFNLVNAADNLYAADGSNRQTVGVMVEDFDGDGRQDILRWGPARADNGIYLSKGDGSFAAPRLGAGLDNIPQALQSPDGSRSFVVGDFLGVGSVQILHMTNGAGALGRAAPGAPDPGRPVIDDPGTDPEAPTSPLIRRNQLYYRQGGGLPQDVLTQVTSPTGLVSKVLTREPLPNSARYISERVVPAPTTSAGVVDVTPAMHVITAVEQETGVGKVTTEYFYKGMKVDRAGGRGMLGFHETRQQSPAPDGSTLTVATEFVQVHPYTGVAAVSKTYTGGLDLSGALLSRTTNAYCDKTSPAAPTGIAVGGSAPAPCANPGKVQRPYVYESLEEGWDLNSPNLALPSVRTTSTYNDAGDPLTINVVTTGTALGLPQTFTKLTTNTYKPDDTTGNKWILGRLDKATVTNTVPNSLGSIATGYGTSPTANVRVGTGPPPKPAPLPPGVLNAILQLLLDD